MRKQREKQNKVSTRFLLAGEPIEGNAHLAFSDDSNLVACCHLGGTTVLWDTKSGARLQTIKGASGYDVAIADASGLVATYGQSQVGLHRTATGEQIAIFTLDEEFLYTDSYELKFSPTEQLLILSNGSSVHRWDVVTRTELPSIRLDAVESILRCEYIDDHLIAFSICRTHADENRAFRFTDLDTGKRLIEIPFDREFFVSNNGLWLALKVVKPNEEWHIWNLVEMRRTCTIPTDRFAQFGCFSAKCEYFSEVKFSDPKLGPPIPNPRINNWTLPSGLLRSSLDSPFPYLHMRQSPMHQLTVLIANSKGALLDKTVVIDGLTGQRLAETSRHPVYFADNHQFSPCGRWFATASTANSLPFQKEPLSSDTVVLSDLASVLPST